MLKCVDRVWHDPIESGVVGIRDRADEPIKRLLAEADVQPETPGRLRFEAESYSSLVTSVTKFGQCFSGSSEKNVPLPAVRMSASG